MSRKNPWPANSLAAAPTTITDPLWERDPLPFAHSGGLEIDSANGAAQDFPEMNLEIFQVKRALASLTKTDKSKTIIKISEHERSSYEQSKEHV